MDKFYKGLFITIIISSLVALAILLSKSIPAKLGQSTTIPVSYASSSAKIPPQIVDYLKNSQQWSNYYNSNKKFAIYYTGISCPYGESFATAMGAIASNPSIQQYYYFYPKVAENGIKISTQSASGAAKEEALAKLKTWEDEASNSSAFDNLCHEFCIVNPVKGELFFLDGVGEEDAVKMPKLFEDLKNW